MTEDTSALPGLLRNKRIGLVGCAAMEIAVTGALRRAQASFAHIDAAEVGPGSEELDRFHALILDVGGSAIESDWFRPELLRTNPHPLLLAGETEAVGLRLSLQEHADDTIFAPFSASELIVRLSRLTAARDARRAVAPSAKPCVVVADDDRYMINTLQRVFQNLDVDVHFVSDGGAALAAARRLLPDLLLLDVRMPVMNGLDVLRCLRKDAGTSFLATVLLTASGDQSDVEEAAGLDAVDYILKPFGYNDLTRKLKPLLHKQSPAVLQRVA